MWNNVGDIPFEVVKKELSKRRNNIAYFTNSFYNSYLEAVKESAKLHSSGNKSDYTAIGAEGTIKLSHSFDKVKESEFYKQNGSAYLCFLDIMRCLSNIKSASIKSRSTNL